MTAYRLVECATSDTTGRDTQLRIIGARHAPETMTIQIAVEGTGNVQIQGRIAKDAPWVDIGDQHRESSITYIRPVEFLRAVVTGVGAGSTISVWATWGF
ncbi:MAG TPA: hypothetical protein VLT59_13600 [Steroidobacteraceae bacterium]|nr:hypothetical protein [Steroidobacteraceae bacterium]